MKPHVDEMLGHNRPQATHTDYGNALIMHNFPHDIQSKYRCAAIEKALPFLHDGSLILLICILMEVRTAYVLWTRLRFEQSTFCHNSIATQCPYPCRVPSLGEDDTRIVEIIKRLVQELKKR